jgi:hypothetical protein
MDRGARARPCSLESAGYPIVLHVHDELVCEVPDGFGSTEEFTHLMTRKPAWLQTQQHIQGEPPWLC